MKLRLLFALFALFAMPAVAATIQQDFDAAQAKLDAQDFYGARDAFTTLLARFPAGAKGASVSVVRARLGNALIATNDPDAAVPLLEAALPGLKATTPAEAELRATAWFDLGRALEASGALDAAAGQYRQALDLKAFAVDSPVDIGMRAALARTLIWSNPGEARRLLDGLLALPPAQLSGDSRGLVLTLRGRVELNNGDPAAAKRWFEQAATSAGGEMTRQINVADMRIRGDLALANYALGDMKGVSRAMHYAGAGGDLPTIFSSARNTSLPACAPLTGLAPDAVAVVEFGLGDDGRVANVTPIYARRGAGEARRGEDTGPEVLFTEAVRGWFWPGDVARKMPGFWRQVIRVELRCLTQRSGSPLMASFEPAFAAWYGTQGIAPASLGEGNDAVRLPAIKAELARRTQAFGPSSPQLLPLLLQLVANESAPDAERLAAARSFQLILQDSKAPAELVLLAQLFTQQAASRNYPEVIANLGPLLKKAEAEGLGETRAAMMVRIMLANTLVSMGSGGKAQPLYEAIAAAPQGVLPDNDPIRQQALLRRADYAARKGDAATANDAIAATGLAPEQCALVDVRPEKINGVITEEAFPTLARDWGNSGYVKTGFDITVEGKPKDVRTVIASPPFIFGPDTERAIARFRYRPVFRPGNKVGCTSQTQPVRFSMGPTY